MTFTLDTGRFFDRPHRIMIIGCGGTGGFVAESLCRLMIGRPAEIVLVDHDRVEPHNLLRQNFIDSDVGRYKSEALAERLTLQFGRTIGYSTMPFMKNAEGRWPGEDQFRTAIIVGCVDNARARHEIHQYVNKYVGTGGLTPGTGGTGDGS